MRVLTLGTFDLLHVGHLEMFRECRRWAGPGGRVIVAVNRDEFVERFKGRRPAIPYAQRFAMLEAVRDVDLVVPNVGDEDAIFTIEAIAPDIIAIGNDWQGRDYLGQLNVTQGWLDLVGIRVVYVRRTTGVASSEIRASL